MAQRKKKSRPRKRTQEPPKSPKAAKTLAIALPLAVIAVFGIVYFVFFTGKPTATSAVSGSNFTPRKITHKAQSLNELLSMSPVQLADMDIAEMNLLCATGLPGAGTLDIDHCLATLDRWAARVKFETLRHLYRAHHPKWARHYRNSEAYLRASFLLQVLQEDLGVKYDMTAKDNFAFNDSRVAFIHGMIPAKGRTVADTPGGTCTSMPVMYVAIGRRLGYPLKLVTTNAHIFVRWDGLDHPNPAWRERFNIEGAGKGFSSFADDYYKTWPLKTTDYQVRANRYLISLTPREELAQFLAARGHCDSDNNRLSRAARCYENAYRCDTTRPCYRAWFTKAAMRCGYRPATPALARLLAHRRRPIIDSDLFVHRTNTPGPNAASPAAPRPGIPQIPAVYGPPHPTTPTPAQPHIPQSPRIPQMPQPIRPQHYPQPIPGRPPRSRY
ncbi:MAG: hypothetical protein ISS69_16760 [Phycisphaerae bacterium]|nr:hypothetical protein [Phycisphaerae bacterium]